MQTKRLNFFRSIRGQLILWFLALGLVPVLVVGIVAYISAQDALSKNIENQYVELAANRVTRIQDWMADSKRIAQSLGRLPGVAGDNNPAGYAGIGDIVLYRGDAENRERHQQAYEVASAAISAFIESYTRVDAAFLIGTDGTVVLSTAPDILAEGDNVSSSALIDLETGLRETYTSDAQLNRDGDRVILIVGTPIRNPSGRLVGMLALYTNIDRINEMMADYTGLGETGEVYLVDHGDDALMITDSRFYDGLPLTLKVNTEGVQRAFSGVESGVLQYADYRGTHVLGVWQTVDGTDWVALAEIDTNEAFGAVVDMATLFVIIGMIAAVAIAFIAYWVARAISTPIQEVTRIAVQVAGGDTGQRAEVRSENEIGILAQAFNSMIDTLNGVITDIKQIVRAVNEGRLDVRADDTRHQGSFKEIVTGLNSALDAVIDPLTVSAGHIKHISEGDLSQEVREGVYQGEYDKLLQSVSALTRGLRRTIGKVQESAMQVASASQQISSAAEGSAQSTQQVAMTIQQIAEGTAQQSESVSSAMATVEQVSQAIEGVARGAQEQAASIGRSVEITASISNMTQQVASNAQEGAASASDAAQTARNGTVTVKKTLQGMENIRRKVEVSAQKVREMGQRSEHIGAIVETIDGIASQTNLLALNATIEAARAGEHGKGFAVVADEVRNLAEKAASATQEIAKLIKDVQKTTQEAIQAMDEGAAEVEAGVVQANESGLALDSILGATEGVNRQIDAIAKAAQQMSASVSELVTMMDTVSAIVEENTAATEEMAASADEVAQAFEAIASVSEENSAATEEVNAATEEVTSQAVEVSASAQLLLAMAQELQQAVAVFKLEAAGFTPTAHTLPGVTIPSSLPRRDEP